MSLEGLKVAILAGPDYEDLELHYPLIRLQEEGAEVRVVGPARQEYRGKHGLSVVADLAIEQANPEDFDILVIPGGWAPDRLRRIPEVVNFVREFFLSGKPVAAICHGAQILISAKVLRGFKLTCVSAIKDDVENAGAIYMDTPVVRDRNLITSRIPADLPFFLKTLIEAAKELKKAETKL
ncbi:MAG: type 1 glutamine amidotransferase [Aigarchaeota archaeon]|nr:type 1 glutamine amidotransferase [Candidatus Pelearchaeum maunauluense]